MQSYQFDDEYFLENEIIIFSLIFSDNKRYGIDNLKMNGVQCTPEQESFISLLNHLMKTKGNIKNLTAFFSHPFIQELWWGKLAYFDSDLMKSFT